VIFPFFDPIFQSYIGASIALTGSPDTFCDNPDLVATEGKYAWGAGLFFWMEHSKEGTTCHTESLKNSDFGGTLNNVSVLEPSYLGFVVALV
jgi:hypothetical protein